VSKIVTQLIHTPLTIAFPILTNFSVVLLVPAIIITGTVVPAIAVTTTIVIVVILVIGAISAIVRIPILFYLGVRI